MLYAITVYLFRAAQSWDVHTIWYFYAIMFLQGVMSSTGWPGVVAAYGSWVGEGTVMGVWQSNPFFGKYYWKTNCCGLSGLWLGKFIRPPWLLILGGLRLIVFLFLVPHV
jgi:sugar phosphate permease